MLTNVKRFDADESELKTCLIGTYPPRECGIGTFTRDLRNSLNAVQANVIAITNDTTEHQYPEEVIFEIRQHDIDDYRLAAEYINSSGVDLVCLQHEFGIFGGPDGSYINTLLADLTVPVVTTLHTVLTQPRDAIRENLIRVAELSDRLVVLNGRAIPILRNVYGVSDRKIGLIHHGVPDVPFIDPNFYKDKFGVEGRLVILTFGLLNTNKGIELMIEAMPEIVKKQPTVVYLVLGATHPEVRRTQGEGYRRSLEQRVRELNLQNHVIFYDRYVSFAELCEFIGSCDIYVTPYHAKEQIVSGTLAYAVGMGKAVVSTPYLYAEELLSDGRGSLVDFGDARGLAYTIIDLIENEAKRHRMRKRAYEYGREMIWKEVGKRYSELFERIAHVSTSRISVAPTMSDALSDLTEIKLDHLISLTDDTAIIQHAAYGIPDRRSGYSTDDVGRAIVVAVKHYEQIGDDAALPLVAKYLSFLQLAQLPDGRFHNFMNYQRHFTDEVGSEDTQGRALWGLGAAVSGQIDQGARALARELFETASHKLKLHHPRALAYAICGQYEFLRRYDGAAQVRRKLEQFARRLVRIYERSTSENWNWFGDDLTYANAKMPQAMLLAADITGDERFLKIGIDSLEFLLAQTYRDGVFDFPGNRGWQRRQGKRAIFGQQPIEAGYTAEALMTAARITDEERYAHLARAAVEWLLGRNRLGAPLFDVNRGTCADGLDPRGPSMNKGAESVICSLLGLLSLSLQKEIRMELSPPLMAAAAATTLRIQMPQQKPVRFSRSSTTNRYVDEESVRGTLSSLRGKSDPDRKSLALPS
ncbi:MAG TPA: glycosyltransferase [Pyrinomonadaceae bacterium]